MSDTQIGFIGLGNMGKPMAGHIARTHPLLVHDIAGTEARAPDGAAIAKSNRGLIQKSDIIVLSLPTVSANAEVVDEIAANARPGTLVIDACTIGVQAANRNGERLTGARMQYVDAPVSGLAFRAEEGTLATMCSGTDEAVARAKPIINCYSRVLFHVGIEAGQGQRMKLVNNALCISQYVITSEALAYGESGGLDVSSMLDVINESSGMNFSTSVIFPKYVATERYDDSGSEALVPCKDLGLFVSGTDEEGTPNEAVKAAYRIFESFTEQDPKRDQMWIYPYVKGKSDST